MLYFSKYKVIITVVVFFISVATVIVSNVYSNKFLKGIKLGIDLRGGSYLVLEPNLTVLKYDYKKQIKDVVYNILSNNSILYTSFSLLPNGISFILNSKNDFSTFKTELLKYNKSLKVTLDSNKVTIIISDKALALTTHDILNQSIEVIRRRVDEFGTKESVIQIKGSGIVVELPGVDKPQKVKDILGRTARISFHKVDSEASFNSKPIPFGYRYVYGNNSIRYAISIDEILTGKNLTKAALAFNNQNQPVVAFTFDTYGAKKFAKATAENIGKMIAIVLDNKVISAPVVNTAILGGSGIIEGRFTLSEAQDLALLLQTGSLPVPLAIVEENTIGPTLGTYSIKSGMYSTLFGLLLVLVYMILFYRKLGLVANISLICNIFLTLALLSIFEVTLTLPGIAGFILGMGMAVDSNILVYERFNFEVKYARAAVAMSNSFNRVYQTLIDSNATTLFAAIFLFYFGSGYIRGFAVNLIITILASMFSIFFTTRLLVNWIYLRYLKTN